jgi:hypothetical protein
VAIASAAFLWPFACAHRAATVSASPECFDARDALRTARNNVRQTELPQGTSVSIDESRTSYDDDRASWRFWLVVGSATQPGRAFLYVRKSDCSTDWEPFVYQM